MTTAQLLLKEKIISVSDLQKNPMKALEGDIIRIVKNGKELGVFMSKAEFEDLLEESLLLKATFRKELEESTGQIEEGLVKSLDEIL